MSYLSAELHQGLSYNGVDRPAKTIQGVIVAEAGAFRSRQGQFDEESLSAIVKIINSEKQGKLSYFGHPSGGNDVERPFLGVVKNARLDGSKVRADLMIADVAMKAMPNGGTPPGEYLMDLADEDPRAVEMSIRVQYVERKTKERGRSPLWDPKAIRSVDVVRTGDATKDGLLNSDDLPTGTVEPSDENTGSVLEESTLAIDKETKEFISQVVADAVTGSVPGAVQTAVAASLAEVEKVREEKRLEDEKHAKLEEGELALKANSFLERAVGLTGFDPTEAVKISSQIKSGELSYEKSLERLADHQLSTSTLSESGEADTGAKKFEDKVEAALAAEFESGKAIYEDLNLSFDDYKNEHQPRVEKELASAS